MNRENGHSRVGNQPTPPIQVKNVAIGTVSGALAGAAVYIVQSWGGPWCPALIGGVAGGAIGIFWNSLHGLRARLLSEEWRISEIQLDTLGQKWKLVNSGSQRRVAWALFIELSTRVSTIPMLDEHGDDGIAMKSLYDLFADTRRRIVELEPTRLMPSSANSTDTVETFALAMLNKELRPFLTRWHPIWDSWRAKNPDRESSTWDQHSKFRDELKSLQHKLKDRAEGFARIAEIPEIQRFMCE